MAEQVTRTVIVKGDPDYIYDLWANFDNFPHFMKYVKSVEKMDDRRSEWVVEGPLGTDVRWQAEMTRGERGKRIAWSSKDYEGTITTSGQVTFVDMPEHQTEITVLLQYDTPGGKLGEVAAQLFGNPEKRLETDLRNFKKFAEGENKPITSN
jgi:uncharacterized membrane protein